MIVAPGIFFYLLFQDVIHVPKNLHVEVQLWICVGNMLKPSVTNHSYPQTSATNVKMCLKRYRKHKDRGKQEHTGTIRRSNDITKKRP